jgi:acyl-CoA thioester hydrolase
MFEIRLRTHWADSDPAGIVFYPHYFRFIEEAEEELFRAAGKDRFAMLQENKVWMPRAETFAKFMRPIKLGAAIRIRLHPKLQGEKAVRYDFEFLDESGKEKLTEGYVTVVCVDAARFRATPIPGPIREVIESATDYTDLNPRNP